MAAKSMIIVGGGLAGLSTGCYAQMNGYRTRILEHAAHAGGLAVAWRRRDYLIDGGIHFLMGRRPDDILQKVYRELGTARQDQLIPMELYGRCVDQQTGRELDITKDMGKLEGDLRAMFPQDLKVIDELFSGLRSLRNVPMSDMMLTEPSEVMTVGQRLGQFWRYRKLFKFMMGKYSRPMSEFSSRAKDPLLKFILLNMFLPEVPAWFVLMVLRMLEDDEMAFIDGGCEAFVMPIVKRYTDLGGEISYESTVEGILVKDGRAVGVRLGDGTEHRADIVVSAADGHGTLFDLLEGRFINDKIRKRYDTWKTVRPIVMVSFGVAREFKGEPPFKTFRLDEPFVVGPDKVEAFSIRVLNYSDKFAPPGKTVVQAMFDSDWDFWEGLREDPPRYASEKERVASEMLKRLEMHYPGFASQVEVTDVATPFTTWRYTLNWKGSYMGWSPTAKVLMSKMEISLPKLSNFYLAGQWATPGGGVPPSLISGRNLIQILCHREHRPFKTTEA
jgi:phytoene dehydrogenase-like protein